MLFRSLLATFAIALIPASAFARPANNACANAIGVSAGGTFNGTLVGATNDGVATCGSSATNPDVWYSFTAGTCAVRLVLDTCGSNAAFGVDTVVSIMTLCGGFELACNDDHGTGAAGCGLNDSQTSLVLSPSQTVKIRVSKFSTRILAPFTLHVRYEPVGYVPPPTRVRPKARHARSSTPTTTTAAATARRACSSPSSSARPIAPPPL